MAHDGLGEVRTGRDSGPVLTFFEDTFGGDEGEALDDILDVSVGILFHTRSPGADPSSHSGKL